MKIWSRLVLLALATTSMVGCLRDDDEPTLPSRPISRLYISTSEYQPTNNTQGLENVYLVEPADAELFDTISRRFRTNALGGSAVVYSPEAQLLFQSGQNVRAVDNSIQVYSVDTLRGSLAQRGVITSELLTAVRSLVYHPNRDLLFAPNSAAAPTGTIPTISPTSVMAQVGATQSDLYVYRRPSSKNGISLPTYRIPFTNRTVYALFVHDLSIRPEETRNRTYVSTYNSSSTDILVYNELTEKLVNSPDSVRRDINPDFTLSVPTARNLTSMAYSPTLDLMVATEAPVGAPGRILFFNEFSKHTGDSQIAPDRVISGGQSQLGSPSSVSIDKREGAQYIYVANASVDISGAVSGVLRFNIDDEGGVAPNKVLRIAGRTPVGVSLDARGTIPEDGGGSDTTRATVRRR